MRKHMYLITEHRDDERVGLIEFSDSRHARVTKNDEGPVDMRNMETGESWTYMAVGLGYQDFADGVEYEERAGEVARRKLREIDDEHLDKAGLELEQDEEAAA